MLILIDSSLFPQILCCEIYSCFFFCLICLPNSFHGCSCKSHVSVKYSQNKWEINLWLAQKTESPVNRTQRNHCGLHETTMKTGGKRYTLEKWPSHSSELNLCKCRSFPSVITPNKLECPVWCRSEECEVGAEWPLSFLLFTSCHLANNC